VPKSLRSQLLSVMVVVTLAAAAARGDSLSAVTSQTGLSPDSSISWAQLGGDQTQVSNSFSAPSNKGLSTTVTLLGTYGMVAVVCTDAPPASQNCSWNSTGFTAGDALLWTVNPWTGGNGPVMLTFASAITGAGALIQSDVPGQFTASIQAFNGNTSLGTFTAQSDAAGDAIYLGVQDSSGPNITAIAYSLTACAGMCADFAIDAVDLATPVAVPNVVGLTQTAATTAITNANLVVGSVTTVPSSTVPSGSVISQNPTAATLVNPGSAVNLVVSTGPAQIAVPNVIGETQAAATSDITNAGLVVGTVTTASSSTVPSGSVISQNPTGSTLVNPGSAVNLVVSSGPAQVPVPNVVGLTQAAATTAITNAGLVVGTVTTASSSTVPAGSVISQSPTGGTPVNVGSAVNLVISSGSAAVITVTPGLLPFGDVDLGSTESLSVTVKNVSTASLKITNITFNYGPGAGKDFGYTTQCGGTIKPGKTCTITVKLHAQDPGYAAAVLNIFYNGVGSPVQVGLTGNVINAKAKVNKSSLSFGNVKVGQSSTLAVILTSSGTSSLTINGISVSGSSDFTESDNCMSPLSQGVSCTINVTFAPSAKKSRTGTLRISDNASSSPQTVSLSGKGN
jgi:beta-lactam-binding protein with PASTA domain